MVIHLESLKNMLLYFVSSPPFPPHYMILWEILISKIVPQTLIILQKPRRLGEGGVYCMLGHLNTKARISWKHSFFDKNLIFFVILRIFTTSKYVFKNICILSKKSYFLLNFLQISGLFTQKSHIGRKSGREGGWKSDILSIFVKKELSEWPDSPRRSKIRSRIG